MRTILFTAIFTLLLQSNFYVLASSQATSQAQLGDPCQFVIKGSSFGARLSNNFHNLPLSYGNERLPIQFYIDSQIPNYLIEPIYETVSDWNTSAGSEVVTLVSFDENAIAFTGQADQKNTIHWGFVPNSSILASAFGELPSPIMASPTPYLQISTINIAINNAHPDVGLINQTENSFNRVRNFIEIFQDIDPEISPDDLQNFEAFIEMGDKIVHILQNATIETARSIFIRGFELRIQSLSSRNFDNENAKQLEIDLLDQLIDIYISLPDEDVERTRDTMATGIEELFSRSNFEAFSQRATYLAHFKSVFKHEIGHALGLRDIHDEELPDITEQIPLMWHPINGQVDTLYNSIQIDPLALHALSCTYDLKSLRQAQP